MAQVPIEEWLDPSTGGTVEIPLTGGDPHGCVLVKPSTLRILLRRAGFKPMPMPPEWQDLADKAQ